MWMLNVLDALRISNDFSDADGNGWKSTRCCYCNDHGRHLGININSGAVNCFRCGTHFLAETLQKLTGVSRSEVISLIKENNKGGIQSIGRLNISSVKPLTFKDSGSLNRQDKRYLIDRGFDPEVIVKEWDVKGSTNIGRFAYRLIIPIYFQKKMVAFQGRDVTEQARLRYKSSSSKIEGGMDVKSTLYGYDKLDCDRVLVVEGPTDVWRLGPGAAATYGTEFTPEQVFLISQFSNRFIMFDSAPEAQMLAVKLTEELSIYSGSTELITFDNTDSKDPGGMADTDANYIMRELGLDRRV